MRWEFTNSSRILIVFTILISILLSACGTAQPKIPTVAIIKNSSSLDIVINAFKAGLTDLGYVEGKNITYQDSGTIVNPDDLTQAVQKLVASKIDLIFAPGTTSLAAQKGTKGTDIPVVFAAMSNPVEQGLVQSLANPGENVTGVAYQVEVAGKTLSYLALAVPTAKRVLIIYDPKGPAAAYLPSSKTTATQLGLELVLHEVHSDADVVSVIQNLPTEIDAIYMVPDAWLGPHSADLVKATIARKLPFASSILSAVNTGAVLGFGRDQTEEGKQAARLASQILKGVKPASLPIESPEYHLAVNLKTAQAIGLSIPDQILRQATTVVR